MGYEVVFESERLYFIKLSEDLVNDYLEMINNPEVRKTISKKEKHYSVEDELSWIRDSLKNNAITFSMIEKDTNEFVGNISINRIRDNIGDVGISITPKKQNSHYGQEGIKRLIEYSFDELHLDGLELSVYTFNPRGIRCYEKVGFVSDYKKDEDTLHMSLKNKQ